MSKRKTMQLNRRQMRHALDKSVDFFRNLGIKKAGRIHYGGGVHPSNLKEHDRDNDDQED